MEFLYAFIKNVCVFTLVITLILNIFPDSRYKKYIKLFAGVLLIALVFNPIVQWKNSKMDINRIISGYTRGSYDIDLQSEVEEIENKMYERISDEYKEDNGH